MDYLSKLPASGAIVWGNPSGAPVTIFTDLHCGFCRALANELEQMNVRVIERPISTLGTRDLSNRVYCAKDKPSELCAAYAGAEVRSEARRVVKGCARMCASRWWTDH